LSAEFATDPLGSSSSLSIPVALKSGSPDTVGPLVQRAAMKFGASHPDLESQNFQQFIVAVFIQCKFRVNKNCLICSRKPSMINPKETRKRKRRVGFQ